MTTNNHPAHGPVSLERLHQIRETLSKAATQSDGGNLGYAMADAVKVIDGAIVSFDAEPVGYFYETEPGNWYQRSAGDKAPKWVPLYAAPVVPDGWVMVPKIPTPEIKSVIHKIGFRCNCRYCQERHWNELLEAAQEVKSA